MTTMAFCPSCSPRVSEIMLAVLIFIKSPYFTARGQEFIMCEAMVGSWCLLNKPKMGHHLPSEPLSLFAKLG
jgi:hypothetical protein